MDSTQMWFCRDLWTDAARGGLKGQGIGRGAFGQQDADNDDDQMLGGGAGGGGALGKGRKGKVIAKRGVDDFVDHHEAAAVKKRAAAADAGPVAKAAAAKGVDEDEDEDAEAAEAAPVLIPVKIAEVEVEPEVAIKAGEAEEEVKKDFLKQAKPKDGDERQTGSDADAMMVEESEDDDLLDEVPTGRAGSSGSSGSSGPAAAAGGAGRPSADFLIPNSAFKPARIVVNPRCVTTYGGVSHAALAQDLFGAAANEWSRDEGEDDDAEDRIERYAITEWLGPPDSFVCQEMRTTGGRVAPKVSAALPSPLPSPFPQVRC
jgi:hypothetical protein